METATINDIAQVRLFYEVSEIAEILGVSPRSAYNLCNKTKDFKVKKIGRLIRVNKESFNNWLNS